MRRRALGAWLTLTAAGILGALIGWSGGGTETASAGWTQARSMPQRRSYIAAAEVGGLIYTVGGMVGETGRPLPTFTRYDPARDEWATLPQLPVATRAAAGVAAGGRVYVVGGTTASGNTRAVYTWNGRRWSGYRSLPVPRFNHAAVALGGRIYVLGGFDRGEEHDEVFVNEAGSNRPWFRVADVPRPSHAFGVVAFRGEIWLIGGRRGEDVLREVWIYDPRRDRWRRGPALPRPMELLGAAVVGDEIHAVWEATYQIYDAATGRWRDGPRPLVTRHALRAFHADGDLITLGGCTTALRDSPVVERRAVGA